MLEKLSKEEFINNDDGLQRFCNINLEVLNQHAPQNKKYVRDNQMLFMRKQLSKKLMNRSRICNNFLRNIGKEITVYLFCKNLRKSFIKAYVS